MLAGTCDGRRYQVRSPGATVHWGAAAPQQLRLCRPMVSPHAALWQNDIVFQRLTQRKEWKFFAALPKAGLGLSAAWWTVLLLRGILPAAFAIAMGTLVGAVQHGAPLAGPLALAGAIFVVLQVVGPVHQAVSTNLGDRTAAWLYDRLTEACVRPPGMGHLEDATL